MEGEGAGAPRPGRLDHGWQLWGHPGVPPARVRHGGLPGPAPTPLSLASARAPAPRPRGVSARAPGRLPGATELGVPGVDLDLSRASPRRHPPPPRRAPAGEAGDHPALPARGAPRAEGHTAALH